MNKEIIFQKWFLLNASDKFTSERVEHEITKVKNAAIDDKGRNDEKGSNDDN